MVFDIGNVLVRFDWNSYVRSLWEKVTADRVTEAIFGDLRWDELDRGVLSPDFVLDSFIAADPEMKREIVYTFKHCLDSLHPLAYAASWVKSVRERGLQTLYLSNYSRLLLEGKPEVLDFLPYMDGGVFSFRVGAIKPDLEIYRILCRKYSLDPRECIFIDDRPQNVAAAEAVGFQTILFTDYEQGRAALDELLSLE